MSSSQFGRCGSECSSEDIDRIVHELCQPDTSSEVRSLFVATNVTTNASDHFIARVCEEPK